MLWRVGVVLALIGVGLTVWGWEEYKLYSSSEATPQEITCADLGARGPGANSHVALTSFVVTEDFVVEEDKKTGKWRGAWVPAVPAEQPDAGAFHVILYINEPGDQATTEARIDKPRIQGLVINSVRKLQDDTVKLLRESYPRADIARCWVIEIDRQPRGGAMVAVTLGGGVILVLAGAGLLIVGLLVKARRA